MRGLSDFKMLQHRSKYSVQEGFSGECPSTNVREKNADVKTGETFRPRYLHGAKAADEVRRVMQVH